MRVPQPLLAGILGMKLPENSLRVGPATKWMITIFLGVRTVKFEVSFFDGFERLIIAILIEEPRNLDCFLPTRSTPPKTNMAPENGPLEKEIPIGNL